MNSVRCIMGAGTYKEKQPLAERCGKAVLRAEKNIRETNAPKFMVTSETSAEEQGKDNMIYCPAKSIA